MGRNLIIERTVGQVKLNVHCYEVNFDTQQSKNLQEKQTHDMEMMIRNAKQFNFSIAAFHHASEAWQIADVLKENGIAAALFADHWGYKKEAYDASVNAPSILSKAGVPVAFK